MSVSSEMSVSPIDPKTRYVLFPIENPAMWDAYKDMMASFWTAEEMDMTEDIKHYRDKLNASERKLLDTVLQFFAASDTIVAANIDTNFVAECQKRNWSEAVVTYQFQMMMENIHSEAYSLMIQNLVPDRDIRQKHFDSIHTVPSIRSKAEWCLRWMGRGDGPDRIPPNIQHLLNEYRFSDEQQKPMDSWLNMPIPTFGERLVAFICVEAIFFSTSFAVIFWFKKRGLLPGICFANELISKDEGMHYEFGVLLEQTLESMQKAGDPLGEHVAPERILEIVKSCVELEQSFVKECLQLRLTGINEEKMSRYAEFVADRVLLSLGCSRFYYPGDKSPENPCEWMESLSFHHKTNFFERRVAAYQRRGVKQIAGGDELNKYRTDVDF